MWANEDKITIKLREKGEVDQAAGKLFEERYLENLLKQKCRGKSFCI
jgi:hypothetical protein